MTTNASSFRPELTDEESADYFTKRLAWLVANDEQIKAALPSEQLQKAKSDSSLSLSRLIEKCFQAYADRPAMGQRASRLVRNEETGKIERRFLDHYDVVTYQKLWSRIGNLASYWYHNPDKSLRANDFLCIIAFAGPEYIVADLAGLHNGVVVVPVQTNAHPEQLADILKETEPRWIAASTECLSMTVDLVLANHQPAGILLFDYHPEVDEEREIYALAQAKLAKAGLDHLLVTIDEACEQGASMQSAPIYDEPSADRRLCSVFYTSGSTGSPKGAMFSEYMMKSLWQANYPFSIIYLHYLPMNHILGRSGAFHTFCNGGTLYFSSTSDLSTLFEDIALVRPTFMGLVPRLSEMIYHQYKSALNRKPDVVQGVVGDFDDELLLDIRNRVLGGRLLSCLFAGAPTSTDLRIFMGHCLGFKVTNGFGTTETLGLMYDDRLLRPPVNEYKLIDVPELGYFTTDKPYPRGEWLVKSDHIMLGYYKRPDATATVFDADGFYKTGDIMAEIEPDRLVYVDRRNNVQKLSQGEFVAISLMETTFTNGHPLIEQAYLYGSSERAYLLGVIVPNREILRHLGIEGDDVAVKAALREALNEVARRENLNAHEVPRDFIVEYEPFSTKNGLLAGIAKYQRPKFKERYGPRLEKLYETLEAASENELEQLRIHGKNLPVLEVVARAVKASLGLSDLDANYRYSFAELGGDSLAALTCSILLEEIYGIEIPASAINNPAGSLHQLAKYIEHKRGGAFGQATFASVYGKNATEIRAADLTIEKFVASDLIKGASNLPGVNESIRTVLVTGVNGYLGRFLCLEWLERMAAAGGKVVAIVRGEDNEAAYRRLAAVYDGSDETLRQRFEHLSRNRLEVLAGDMAEERLGVSDKDWNRLAETVDHICHPAAFVNHVLPYPHFFGPNSKGTAELIALALTHHMKSIDYVSSLGVALKPDGAVLSEDDDVRSAIGVRRIEDDGYAAGYATSKWTGEVLLRDASERFGLPCSVFRCDMIMAHSKYRGQFNAPDMFSRWLFSLIKTGLAPKSFYVGPSGETAHYDGLPVDFIAAAIATLGEKTRKGYRTYHVVNPHEDGISFDTFVNWAIDAGHPVTRIDDYDDWYNRFEAALRGLPEDSRQRSSLPLIHQFRRPMKVEAGSPVSSKRFQDDVARFGVNNEGQIPGLSREYFQKFLKDLME